MLIEEELLAYLETSLKAGENKARDKQIIAFYYGFGDVAWPTLERVANQFGLNERERVRQIIKNKFQDQVTPNSLPRAAQLGELIEQCDFVSVDVIQQALVELRLAPEGASLRGLLNLLDDLGLCLEFDIYDSSLELVSRSLADSEVKSFLVRKSYLSRLRKAWTTARNLPGLLGLAKESYLDSKLHDVVGPICSNVKELLRASSDCCYVEFDGQTWYTVEGRDNTLINSCEKLFGVIDSCESAILAEVLANALLRRTHKYPYPGARVIEQFLEASSSFDWSGTEVSFQGGSTPLTEIESDVVAFLRNAGAVTYPNLKSHLEAKGYGNPHIVKATMNSPLVYVDKTGGRIRYSYQLVPHGQARHGKSTDERYMRIRTRLEKLFELGTDVSGESTRRREQGILQDWLFEGTTMGECAICGCTFSSTALVAAHKKKRALCNDKERLDPYVVMPLCVFGCDHLYERGALIVTDGRVWAGHMPAELTHEATFARNLIGRQIDEKWLHGDLRYFDRPDLAHTVALTVETA